MTSIERAKKSVQGIVADLSDRRGLRHEWDQIDDEIRQEIIEAWESIILAVLEEAPDGQV